MGRSPCCVKVGLKKGPWTPEEDHKLLAYIQQHGHGRIGSWKALPPKAGLQRCGKSCRLRWANYLRPDIKRGEFSLQEQQSIIQLHALLGNRWSTIASHLPKRTDNEIKNFWNTHLKKRLTKMGIDPTTHKPKSHALVSSGLSHMAQWETARLEAEARIVRESKLINHSHPQLFLNKPPPPPQQLPCLDILKAWQSMWTAQGKMDISTFFNHESPSPTSILNFSTANHNNMAATTIIPFNNNNYSSDVGLINESTLLLDYAETLGACTIGDGQMKGIMGNSQVHDMIMPDIPTTSNTCFLAEDDDVHNYGFIEDNYKINYWSHILSSPIDPSVLGG